MKWKYENLSRCYAFLLESHCFWRNGSKAINIWCYTTAKANIWLAFLSILTNLGNGRLCLHANTRGSLVNPKVCIQKIVTCTISNSSKLIHFQYILFYMTILFVCLFVHIYLFVYLFNSNLEFSSTSDKVSKTCISYCGVIKNHTVFHHNYVSSPPFLVNSARRCR